MKASNQHTMFEKEFDIATLISLQQRGILSVPQQAQLDAWLAANQANRSLFEQLSDETQVQGKFANFSKISEEVAWSKVLIGIAPIATEPQHLRLWPKVLMAAAAVVAMVFGIWFYQHKPSPGTSNEEFVKNDIAPGKQGATLTLANGERIELSDTKNGVIVDPSALTYDDGTPISSTAAGTRYKKLAEMSASTTKGQTYSFTLPDGSRVWLNAGSTLRFPQAFKGKKRKVSLTGEAYFEVAKDSKHPFLVESNGQLLEVLGTHFNINSYPDEKNIKTTLLEGSVNVSSLNNSQLLKLTPGEQSVLDKGRLSKERVDTEAAMAWRNGYFRFEDEPIESVMRKLSRWYNIEVVYEKGAGSERFNGRISKNNHISKVLSALQTTKTIHFKVEGRRVTVMQ
jgi:transmembrane sensor